MQTISYFTSLNQNSFVCTQFCLYEITNIFINHVQTCRVRGDSRCLFTIIKLLNDKNWLKCYL